MITITDALNMFDTTIDEHHDLQSAIPITAGMGRQGDVIVIPAAVIGIGEFAELKDENLVPKQGTAVVRGESGGNTHLLLAEGPVYFDFYEENEWEVQLGIGVLTVPEGSTAFLAHPEHAFMGFKPGTYEIRRQREQADIIRMVAD